MITNAMSVTRRIEGGVRVVCRNACGSTIVLEWTDSELAHYVDVLSKFRPEA